LTRAPIIADGLAMSADRIADGLPVRPPAVNPSADYRRPSCPGRWSDRRLPPT